MFELLLGLLEDILVGGGSGGGGNPPPPPKPCPCGS